MPVEADSLRILLVHCERLKRIVCNAIFEKLPAKTRTARSGGEKEHFQTRSVDSHEGDWTLRDLRSDNQMRHIAQRLRNIGFDGLNFWIGQEQMRCPNRVLPNIQQRCD